MKRLETELTDKIYDLFLDWCNENNVSMRKMTANLIREFVTDKKYLVSYTGTGIFQNLKLTVKARSEREAVVTIYSQIQSGKFRVNGNGRITDLSGHIICHEDCNILSHENGYFVAEQIR